MRVKLNLLVILGKSFMYIKNNTGPKTERHGNVVIYFTFTVNVYGCLCSFWLLGYQ